MTRTLFLGDDQLGGLVADLLGAGQAVIGPASLGAGRSVLYRELNDPAQLELAGPPPALSLKEFFLPPTEPLLGWSGSPRELRLDEVPAPRAPRVIIGARPCDTAALPVLDKLMGWDYRDEPWFARREATTIVSIACREPDGSCFCTAVGGGPANPAGADVLLERADGGWRAEVLTERGAELAARFPARFAEAAAGAASAAPRWTAELPPIPADFPAWLAGRFDDPLWAELALRCHGCGACAAVCPTCHCFDIVDECAGPSCGTRRRNWDTCQTARFTVHASGHNPRPAQPSRTRQRLLHKFSVFPARFGALLCTGCGRCVRGCPAGIDIVEALDHLGRAAAQEQGA
ncbi:MAG: 4Fe-4S dicluster domain-containing protein [Acidobacteria bacterium]|nr:4Fe-4S dicluster domain-containing protein [Acidobacteriota bacterium]